MRWKTKVVTFDFLPEVAYVIRAELGHNNHYCNVEAFDVVAWKTASEVVYVTPNEWVAPLVSKADADGPELDPANPTSDLDAGRPFFSASVKFDGCLDGDFDAGEGTSLHFCGRAHAMTIGVLMGAVYDLAREVLPPVILEWPE
jgi:hypothetical protein